MRILAIDYGTRRIGLAISDPTGTFASALCTIPAGSWDTMAKDVATQCREKGVERIIIGFPRRTDGKEGEMAGSIRQFAAKLKETCSIDVALWDERFTTAAAERVLLEANVRRSDRKEVRDRVAAQMILQSYLDGLEDREERNVPSTP